MIVLNSILNPEVTIIYTEPRGGMCDDVQERVPQRYLFITADKYVLYRFRTSEALRASFWLPFFFFFLN